jgi:YD repeat-containing protein
LFCRTGGSDASYETRSACGARGGHADGAGVGQDRRAGLGERQERLGDARGGLRVEPGPRPGRGPVGGGLLLSSAGSAGTSAFTYNASAQLASATDAAGTSTYT